MAVVRDFVLNLPHQYYLAIGEFMFRAGQLEVQMQEILWRAIDLDNRQGRVLTVGTAAKTVRAMLQTVVSDEAREQWIKKHTPKGKTIIQRICSLVHKSKEFADLRNKIAHGSWQSPVRGDKSDARLVYMRERDEKYLARTDPNLDDSYLHKKCAELRSLNMKAHELLRLLNTYRGIPLSEMHSYEDFCKHAR